MEKKSLFFTTIQLLQVALPLSAGRVINTAANFIAMMMVAELGKKQLAAGSLAFSTSITLLTLTGSVFFSLGILLRYQRGANQKPSIIGNHVKNSFYLAILIGVPSAFALWHMDKLLILFGQDQELIALTTGYFHFASLRLLPLLGILIIGQFYVGIGRSRFPLIIEMLSFPGVLFLAYALVGGHFGLPAFGLTGLSLANLIMQLVMLIVVILLLCISGYQREFQLFSKPWRPDWQVCCLLLKHGIPIGIQFGGELAVMAAAVYLMGFYGVNALAALQVVTQYSMVVIMLSFGLMQAMALLISEAYGKNPQDKSHIKHYLQAAFLVLSLYCLATTVIFLSFPSSLLRFYFGGLSFNTNLITFANFFFLISCLFLFIDGLRNILSGALRGLHDSNLSMHINLFCMWFISLPVSALFAFTWGLGPVGLRIGFLSGFIVATVWLAKRLYQKVNVGLPEIINVNPENQSPLMTATSK